MTNNNNINAAEIAIALSTYYPKWYRGRLKSLKHTDKIRGDLALELLRKAVNFKYQTVVVDVTSSKSFRKELVSIESINLVKRNSPIKRSPSRRLAFKIASKLGGVKVIIYTDPEKVSLAEKSILDIAEPILENKADIVIPKREPNLFKETYPDYQYSSEIEANRLYNELLRTNGLLPTNIPDLDLFFGPKAFKNDPKVLNLFLRKSDFPINKRYSKDLHFDPEDFSNIIFFPIVLALKKKLRVQSVEVKFAYPVLQKKNEESTLRELFIEKRRVQRLSALIELMHFIQFLQKR